MYFALFALKLILGIAAYFYIEISEDQIASVLIGAAIGITVSQYIWNATM